MRIFMLGWEFPPFISGGLGTACYGLTRAMDQLGMEVTFVLPKKVEGKYATHVRLLTPNSWTSSTWFRFNELENVRFREIDTPLHPYLTPETYKQRIEEASRRKQKIRGGNISSSSQPLVSREYSSDILTEVQRYAATVADLAANEQFDVVHAHNWMTYPAGIVVAATSGKPLIAHVHSTEFDRSGEPVNQMIYDIEREGMERADKIIAVSHFTRNIVISQYGISGDKVEVVYNGVERNGSWSLTETGISKDEKIVLFLGRITMQKGPDYFLQAAKRVLEKMDNVKFVMAGSGDLMHRCIEMAAELGIGHKVLFTGFLRGEDVQKIYKMADLYVMPSVSEPFGIATLEALDNDVPVIISKQSGVSEVLMHAPKVNFWDVNEMANKIVEVLKFPLPKKELRDHVNSELSKLRWKYTAQKCIKIIDGIISESGGSQFVTEQKVFHGLHETACLLTVVSRQMWTLSPLEAGIIQLFFDAKLTIPDISNVCDLPLEGIKAVLIKFLAGIISESTGMQHFLTICAPKNVAGKKNIRERASILIDAIETQEPPCVRLRDMLGDTIQVSIQVPTDACNESIPKRAASQESNSRFLQIVS